MIHVYRNQPTTFLQPLYSYTCISQHLQLSTGGFYWCRVLLPAYPCWQQPAHMHWREDAGVLKHLHSLCSLYTSMLIWSVLIFCDSHQREQMVMSSMMLWGQSETSTQTVVWRTGAMRRRKKSKGKWLFVDWVSCFTLYHWPTVV